MNRMPRGNQNAWNVYGTNLISRQVGTDTLTYIYNGHVNVTALLDTKGNLVATYYYDAFGNILEKTGTADNSILYGGYQYDEETGLYYLNARMYDPVTARFLQEDTNKGSYNDPLSLNQYTYCHNEPLMYSDPTGHREIVGDLAHETAAERKQSIDAMKAAQKVTAANKAAAAKVDKYTQDVEAARVPKTNTVKKTAKMTVDDPLVRNLNIIGNALSHGIIGYLWLKEQFDNSIIGAAISNYRAWSDKQQAEFAINMAKMFVDPKDPNYEQKLYEEALRQTEIYENSINTAMGLSAGIEIVGESAGSMLLGGKAAAAVEGRVTSVIEKEAFAATKGAGKSLSGYGAKSESYLTKRGWTWDSAQDVVGNPYTTREAVNKATGNSATVFYNKAGDYVVRDSVTGELVQTSKFGDVNWIPDSSIINPYKP